MMMEEACDCAHEQAGQRRLDSLRPTGASTCVVRVQALSLVAVRNNPSPSHHKQKTCKFRYSRAGGSKMLPAIAFLALVFRASAVYTATSPVTLTWCASVAQSHGFPCYDAGTTRYAAAW